MAAAIQMVPRDPGRVDRVLGNKEIKDLIDTNASVKQQARDAAECLVADHPDVPDWEIVKTLRCVLETLVRGKLRVFFSYKVKDAAIANQIALWLEEWSANKLEIEHMARFGIEQVGLDWRKHIENTIPKCDWFLLLLPTPGEEGERDWVLFEAGYFFRGQGLAGRLVCLHHPDNEVVDALGEHQSVAATKDAVESFLAGLFHTPNWIPGMPPLNRGLRSLDVKAKNIVDLIHGRASPAVRSYCGPYMEVAFEDARAVSGWEQLARGKVVNSNKDCQRLFGLQVPKPYFGEWINSVNGAQHDEAWVSDLAGAVQALGDGREVQCPRTTLALGEHRRVLPIICAVKRTKSDQRVESVEILFQQEELPLGTNYMNPNFGALAVTLRLAVEFRYQVLEGYVGRKLETGDLRAFNKAMSELTRQALRDPRLEDQKSVQKRVIGLFTGEDKATVEKMYERADQLWRPDGKGEIECAIDDSDTDAVAKLIEELRDMNQRFLTVTSRRFAELIAGS